MNINTREIVCTCNLCGASYTDTQFYINNIAAIKFHICPKCKESHELEKYISQFLKIQNT